MKNNDILIKKYKKFVKPQKKTTSELINWLKQKVDIEEFDINIFSKFDIERFYTNTYYSINNITEEYNEHYKKPNDYKLDKTNIEFSKSNLYAKYDIKDFDFICYKVNNNNKSIEYYNSGYTNIFEDEGFIYVLFEKKTESFICNCSKLSFDLKIEKSVSKEDYDNNSILLIDLLTAIDIHFSWIKAFFNWSASIEILIYKTINGVSIMKKFIYFTMILICLLSLLYNIFFGLTNWGLDEYIITYATIYSIVTRPAFYFSLLFIILFSFNKYKNIEINKTRIILLVISLLYIFIYIVMIIYHILFGMGEYRKVLYFIIQRMEIFALMGAFMGIGLGKKIK